MRTRLPSESTSRVRIAAIAFALFVGTFAVFSRAIGNDFVNYDDPDYITANEHVRSGLTTDGVRWAFATSDVSYWHPLTWLSHMADWSMFGENPHGHHAMSVLWHAANAALLFLVLRQLTGKVALSALAAAIFALHPLRVESVAWAAERKDVLGAFFSLATIGAYAAYARRTAVADASRWKWYAAALLLFVAGLMSKPMVVTLPALLLVLDFWPLRRSAVGARELKGEPAPRRAAVWTLVLEKVPFAVLSVAISWITVVAQRKVGTLSDVLPLGARIGNAVVGVARYLEKFFAPTGLAVLYPHPGFWPAAIVSLAVMLILAVTAIAMWQWRSRPWILVGWLWFLTVLLPASGIVQVGIQSMADRYTYVSTIGLEIALLWTLADVVGPRLARVLSAGALAGLAILTSRQIGFWSNSFTLFDHTIAVAAKGNYLAYNNRGVALFRAGKLDDAIADYRRSLAINRDYAEANNNLGEALAQKGQTQEALASYRRALALKPGLIEAHNNLANLLSDVGAIPEAIEHYQFALARRPGDSNVLNNYGATLAMAGRLDEAIGRIEQALAVSPNYASAHANLGNILAMRGRREEALAHYRQALALEPMDARSYFNQANVLSELGRLSDAAASYERAVQLAAVNPDAHAALGFTLARLGRREEAVKHLRIALQQRPDFPQAKAWLDAVLAAK